MKLPILYKRSVSGKVSTWYVDIENNKFRTVSGFDDGEKVTSAWTECDAKNIGKKNATTAEQQALAEAQAMHRKRIELGSFEDINKIDEPVYFKPMLAKEYNKEKWKTDKEKRKASVKEYYKRNPKKLESAYEKGRNRGKKKRDELNTEYLRKRLIDQGFNLETINKNPDLIEIKRLIIQTKRL